MPQHDLVERMMAYFLAGGALMAPMALLSLVMWTLALAKGIRFLRLRRKEISPEQCVGLFHSQAAACKSGLARWQWDILSQFMNERCADPELNREMLKAIKARQEFKTMRHIGTILLLAAVAPLLGLLGTVTGMITTFDVISQFGTGNARALASGISEALITTQSGLVVAVPGLILGVLLFRQAQGLQNRMALFCIGLQEQTDGQGVGESA